MKASNHIAHIPSLFLNLLSNKIMLSLDRGNQACENLVDVDTTRSSYSALGSQLEIQLLKTENKYPQILQNLE